MDDLNAKGGSYQRQPDGSMKLVSRTEEPKAVEAKAVEKTVAKAAKPAKDTAHG